MMIMPGLADLFRAGGRAASRYTGTVLTLYVAQSLIAAVGIVTISQLFASSLAHRPIFDEGVDGDLVSLIDTLRDVPHVLHSAAWIIAGVVLLWMIVSWFLVGGVLAVLTERPEGRAGAARCFGAGGANTFLAFAALEVFALVAYLPAVSVLTVGLTWGLGRADEALSFGAWLAAVGLGLAPGAVAFLIVGTIVDYARAELALRKASHELGAARAFVRAAGFVVKHPLTLLHAFLGWMLVLILGVGYAWLAHGRALLGTSGAVTILIVRQGMSLMRMAVKVGILGGQVELGQTRPPPPRSPAQSEPDRGSRIDTRA